MARTGWSEQMNNLLKSVFCAFLCLLVCAPAHARAEDRELKVLASTFPVYLFTKNVCANVPNVKVELLIPASAGCPHDFSLRPGDVQKLAKANILVINGAGLEEYLDKALQKAAPNLTIIDASKGIEPLLDNGHPNPHTFAAPAKAAIMTGNIADALARLDADNARDYESNARSSQEALASLSQKFATIGKKAKNRGIALEHDALAYLAKNADLEIVMMFEHGNSAAKLGRLKKELLELNPKVLAGDAQYADRLLQTLASETNIPYISLNPCASGPEDAEPDYYLQIMEKNLELLEAHFDE